MLAGLPVLLMLVSAILAGFTPSGFTKVAQAATSPVVISEFRVRGPNGGNDEFVEIFNRSSSPVNIGGWKINGSNNAAGVGTRVTISASTTLAPGQHYLFTNTGTSGGPYSGTVAGNQTYATGVTDDGGLALLDATNAIIDQVGMSTGSAYGEGTRLASFGTSNTDRSYRRIDECSDTDDNRTDFGATTVSPSTPQNASSPFTPCGGPVTPVPTNPAGTGAATPATLTAGNATLLTVKVTPGTNPASTALSVVADLSSVGGPAAQTLYDDGTNGDVTASDNTFSLNYTVPAATSAGSKSLPFTITDGQSRSGSGTIALSVTAPVIIVPIHTIQGAAHISPLNNQNVTTEGIVTAVRSNGFYIQDPNPDADPATSEAILVFTSSAPTVKAGDAVQVAGKVSEFRPGGSGGTNNLTTTELTAPVITVKSSNNALPAPVIIGAGGRVPPTTVIEDDASGSVETSGTFDPDNDGIDFYESLEGMLVQVNNAVAVGPTNSFGEIPVLADNGSGASIRTNRGGIVVRSTDFNPERILLDDVFFTTPKVNVGDSFPGTLVGIMDYSFGNFKLDVLSLPPVVPGGLAREVSQVTPGPGRLTIASFNVENLDPNDPQSKFDRLAGLIVNNLKSPDILTLEEIQDNNGPINDGTVDASLTYNKLISAIQAAGGPAYDYRSIDPVNNQDGGEPGGNIRVGFLFRTDGGLSFVDRPGGTSTSAVSVVGGPNDPRLSFSPGRIDPTNSAFNNSRKPLAGEFKYNGSTIFVIANHFNSKGGDQPLFGQSQPPQRSSEVQRHQQAAIVNNFVDSLLAANPDANIAVVGDLNDFEFSETVNILKGGVLYDLLDTLPQAERYTYVFDGNSQAIDHILVSNNLLKALSGYDVVHVNSEFFDQDSDHEPQVAGFTLDTLPPVTTAVTGPASAGPNANGWFNQDVSVKLDATDDLSGVKEIVYTINGGVPVTTAGASVPAFTVSDEGTTVISYFARDNAGNQEQAKTLTIKLDKTPPQVTAVPDRAPDSNGYYNKPVTFSFSGTDANGSGVVGCSAPVTYSGPDSNSASVSGSCSDVAGNLGSVTFSFKYDGTAPVIVINSPANQVYQLNQAVAASYTCTDDLSGVATCQGTVASGTPIDTTTVGPKTFTVMALDAAGNTTTRTVSYSVVYNVCAQYDQTKQHNSGSTVPIKLQLCDANGVNKSSPALVLTAQNLIRVSDNASLPVQSPGKSNSTNTFVYEDGLYQFNVKTTGLTAGVYQLAFTVGTEPYLYKAQFIVR